MEHHLGIRVAAHRAYEPELVPAAGALGHHAVLNHILRRILPDRPGEPRINGSSSVQSRRDWIVLRIRHKNAIQFRSGFRSFHTIHAGERYVASSADLTVSDWDNFRYCCRYCPDTALARLVVAQR